VAFSDWNEVVQMMNPLSVSRTTLDVQTVSGAHKVAVTAPDNLARTVHMTAPNYRKRPRLRAVVVNVAVKGPGGLHSTLRQGCAAVRAGPDQETENR
jgi:hypothetical protein